MVYTYLKFELPILTYFQETPNARSEKNKKLQNNGKEYFERTQTLRQGCPLSPQYVRIRVTVAEHFVTDGVTLNAVLFADDKDIFADSDDDLHRGLFALSKTA